MSQYDRQAEAWLRAKIPGANPKPGSVEFEITEPYDETAYLSVGWQQTTTHQVPWGDPENSYQPRLETVPGDYWGGDITSVIREVMEFEIKDVHTSHCCKDHGCKYADPQCTVTTGRAAQEHPCEQCDDEPNPESLVINVWEASITGFDSEHRALRKAIRRAMDNEITTDLLVHSRRGASIVPTPQGRR